MLRMWSQRRPRPLRRQTFQSTKGTMVHCTFLISQKFRSFRLLYTVYVIIAAMLLYDQSRESQLMVHGIHG